MVVVITMRVYYNDVIVFNLFYPTIQHTKYEAKSKVD